MTAWQWSYPFDSTDLATVVFDVAPANALCHWRAPHVDAPQPRYALVETVDGGIRSYRVGDAGRNIVLRFVGLPVGDDTSDTTLWGYNGILRFLETFCEFSGKPFGFYDHTGTSAELRVRYIGGIETFRRTRDQYDGEIVLRQEVVT